MKYYLTKLGGSSWWGRENIVVKERLRRFCAHPFYYVKLPPPLGGLSDPPLITRVVNVDYKLLMRCSQLRSLRDIGCCFGSRVT